mmetsp:Transcript_22835/g.36464  ORF Transcript_22835/g.36464 Transcript_22835/m.36464 type:complete len:148 (+) Transcript_22835:107-550(+)
MYSVLISQFLHFPKVKNRHRVQGYVTLKEKTVTIVAVGYFRILSMWMIDSEISTFGVDVSVGRGGQSQFKQSIDGVKDGNIDEPVQQSIVICTVYDCQHFLSFLREQTNGDCVESVLLRVPGDVDPISLVPQCCIHWRRNHKMRNCH